MKRFQLRRYMIRKASACLSPYMVALLITYHLSLISSFAQTGTWQNHLAYHDVENICEAGNYLFVLASNDLYQYNKSDQSITTYDKVNGLSDTYITHIAWNLQPADSSPSIRTPTSTSSTPAAT